MGIGARVAFPHAKMGLVAFGSLILGAPPVVLVVVTLGVWAAALAWSAPLMFSGSSSLGMDLGLLAKPGTGPGDLRKYCRWCLFIQAGAILVYALARPDLTAWWMVFGLTLRDAAIFAPTIAILMWRAATPTATVVAMATGVAAGLIWNAMTDFSPTVFFGGINPMYVGTTVSVLLLVVVSLLENRKVLLNFNSAQRVWGWAGVLATVGFAFLSVVDAPVLEALGLLGLSILLASLGVFVAAIAWVEKAPVPVNSACVIISARG